MRAVGWGLGLALFMSAFVFAPARADTRIALVIGNSTYQHAPVLANPRNDAEAMAATLTRLGFEVVKGIDLDQAGMRTLLRQFAEKLPHADVGLFFYAGHGLQVDGRNFLVPVDAMLEQEIDLALEATDLDVVLQLLERNTQTSLVFLDACRDNPLARSLARSMGGTRSTAVGRGLALVQAGVGSFIAYSTQPGNVALDGTGANSPFTTALIRHIETPGLSLSDLMIQVRNDVRQATKDQQVPWDHSSLIGQFFFIPMVVSVETKQSPTTPEPVNEKAMELAFWNSIKDSSNPAQFEAYLTQFPQGTFAALARVKLAELRDKPAAEEKARSELAALPPADTTGTQQKEEAGGAGSSCAAERNSKSIAGKVSTSVVFQNQQSTPAKVYWLDYKGKRVLYQTLAPGQSYVQQTYLTHPWVVTDALDRCLVFVLPDRETKTVTIQ